MLASRISDADYRSLAEFRYQLRLFLAFSEENARAAGLNPQQHQLLLAVRAAEEAPTIRWLAERLVLRHHSVVELVGRLERRDIVHRLRSSDDRRQALVHISRLGERILKRLALAHRDELRRAGAKLVDALERLSHRKERRTVRRAAGGT